MNSETYTSADPVMIMVSRFDNHFADGGRKISLAEVIEEIRSPAQEIQQLIGDIRVKYQAAGCGKAGKEAIRDSKARLPVVAFNAVGSRREPESATGVLAIDLDELGQNLPLARRQFEVDPHCLSVFLSPSGDGLKALIKVPTPVGTEDEMRSSHRRNFVAVRSYIQSKLGLLIDPAASDLLRLCYVSYDPTCSLNPAAQVLDVEKWKTNDEDDPDNQSGDPNAENGKDARAGNATEEVVEALLRSIPPRPDYEIWFKVAAAVRNTLGDTDRAIHMLKRWSPEEKTGEYRHLLERSKFSKIGFGTVVYHARKHGFSGVIEKFFYAGRAGYFMQYGLKFIPLPREADVKQHLRLYGINPQSPDCPTCRIRSERLVSYVGEVAGHRAGLHEFQGDHFLVTKGPIITESRPGGGECVRGFLMRLLATEDPDQFLNFLSWLHRARSAVIKGRRTQIPALVIAGGAGDGKSLAIEIVRRALGGRSANAYKYFSGQTRFNGDLVGAELLFVDDDAAAKDHGSRAAFAQFLKATLFAGSVAAEGKGANAIQCAPVQAVMISVNSDPQHLRVLPELDDTMRDKIILLKSSPSPLPPELAGRMELIQDRLTEDLPGFLHEVDNLDPTEWTNPQTGRLRCHWNRGLLEALESLSPERRLWELIEDELGNAFGGIEWTGTASQLETELTCQEAKNPVAARSVLKWSGACGVYLSRLAKHPDSPVQLAGLTRETRVQQYRIYRDPRPREDCEDSFYHFQKVRK
jgi:hypothetical protein